MTIKKHIFYFIILCNSLALSRSYHEKFEEALQLYKEERFRLSEKKFRNILEKDRDYRDPVSQLFIAKSQVQQGLWDQARRTCKNFLANYQNSPYEVNIYILLGDCAFSEGKTTSAFQNYLKARKLIDNILYKNEVDQRLYNCIGLGLSEEKIEGMLFRERNNFNRAIINLARCYQSWLNGDNYNMKSMIKDIDTYFLPGKFSSIFGELKKSADKNLDRPNTFGVIIPLSGFNKKLGESYLLGLAESFESSNMRFLIYDSEGLGAKALQITKNIFNNNLISGIIGPLTNDEVFALSGSMLEIPILIPKLAPSNIPALNENLFFLSPSMKTLAEKTAHLMINELGYTSIAILSPGYGENKLNTEYFIQECHQLGVDPVAIEWYVETPLDLSRQLKNIRKKAWELIPNENITDEFIDLEIDSIDALFDVDLQDFFVLPNDNQKMDKKDSAKVELETIQAFYIPIGPDELTYVGTQLPFYNLKANIFGNENWLNMQLLNQKVIGPHIQGMHVVSDISSVIYNDEDDSNINFYNCAFEHVSFLESLSGTGWQNRNQFARKLRSDMGYFGDKTTIAFSGPKRNDNRSSQVLKYLNQSIKVIGIYDGKMFRKKEK